MLVAYFRALRARGNILRALQRFLHLLGESVDAHHLKLAILSRSATSAVDNHCWAATGKRNTRRFERYGESTNVIQSASIMTEGGRSLWELYDSEVPPWKGGRTILACIALSHFVLQCLVALAFVLGGSAVRVFAFGFVAVIFWLLFYFVWIGVAWLRWLWGVWNLATGFCLLIWAWRDLSGLETVFGTMNMVIGAYLFSPSVYFFARHQKKTTHWKEALLFVAGCFLIMCNVAAVAFGFWFFLEQHRRDACHFTDDAGQHIYVDQTAIGHSLTSSKNRAIRMAPG